MNLSPQTFYPNKFIEQTLWFGQPEWVPKFGDLTESLYDQEPNETLKFARALVRYMECQENFYITSENQNNIVQLMLDPDVNIRDSDDREDIIQRIKELCDPVAIETAVVKNILKHANEESSKPALHRALSRVIPASKPFSDSVYLAGIQDASELSEHLMSLSWTRVEGTTFTSTCEIIEPAIPLTQVPPKTKVTLQELRPFHCKQGLVFPYNVLLPTQQASIVAGQITVHINEGGILEEPSIGRVSLTHNGDPRNSNALRILRDVTFISHRYIDPGNIRIVSDVMGYDAIYGICCRH